MKWNNVLQNRAFLSMAVGLIILLGIILYWMYPRRHEGFDDGNNLTKDIIGLNPTYNGPFQIKSTTEVADKNNGVEFQTSGDSSYSAYGSDLSWYLRSGKKNGKVILQDNEGNVGVGTTNPKQKLTVNGGDVGVWGGKLQLLTTDGTNGSSIDNVCYGGNCFIRANVSTGGGFLISNGGGIVHRFKADGSFDSVGNAKVKGLTVEGDGSIANQLTAKTFCTGKSCLGETDFAKLKDTYVTGNPFNTISSNSITNKNNITTNTLSVNTLCSGTSCVTSDAMQKFATKYITSDPLQDLSSNSVTASTISGNSLCSEGECFGKKDIQNFKTGKLSSMAVTGSVGIGTQTPTAPLTVIASPSKTTYPDSNALYVFQPDPNVNSIISTRVSGRGKGNPIVSFDVLRQSGYSMGIDNKDGLKFKLAGDWNNLSKNTYLTVDKKKNEISLNGTVKISNQNSMCLNNTCVDEEELKQIIKSSKTPPVAAAAPVPLTFNPTENTMNDDSVFDEVNTKSQFCVGNVCKSVADFSAMNDDPYATPNDKTQFCLGSVCKSMSDFSSMNNDPYATANNKTQFCVGSVCKSASDLNALNNDPYANVNDKTKFCVGSVCKSASDLNYLVSDPYANANNKTQLCVGSVCKSADDFKTINSDAFSATNSRTQFCIGNTCVSETDLKVLKKLTDEYNGKINMEICTKVNGNGCAGGNATYRRRNAPVA